MAQLYWDDVQEGQEISMTEVSEWRSHLSRPASSGCDSCRRPVIDIASEAVATVDIRNVRKTYPGQRAEEVPRVMSTLADAVTRRLVQLAQARHDCLPNPPSRHFLLIQPLRLVLHLLPFLGGIRVLAALPCPCLLLALALERSKLIIPAHMAAMDEDLGNRAQTHGPLDHLRAFPGIEGDIDLLGHPHRQHDLEPHPPPGVVHQRVEGLAEQPLVVLAPRR